MPDSPIRKACAGDLDAVGRMLRQVLKLHHDGRPDLFPPTGKKYTDAELCAIFENPDTPVFVYELDGQVVGYVFCELQVPRSHNLNPIKTLYIDDLCVDECERKSGVGKRLFERVKAYAKENGFDWITLNVWNDNVNALAFYRKMGLTERKTILEYRVD